MSTRRKKNKKLLSAIVTALFIFCLVLYYFPNTFEFISSLFEDPRSVTTTDGELSVHFLDVGQGDCTLIIDPSGQTMLIDTSVSDQADNIIEYLNIYGIKKLDHLVLTHPDSDHIGAASKILKTVGANTVYMTDIVHTTKTFENLINTISDLDIPLVVPKLNDKINLGNAVVTVLGPVSKTDDLNEMSLVLRLDYGETSFMFTGDAGIKSEKEMLEYHRINEFRADVLKLGHHGSSTSSSKDFIDAVNAQYAVVSCGKDNSYGHPHKEVITDMNNRNIKLYRTDTDGNIIFSTDGKLIKLLRPVID